VGKGLKKEFYFLGCRVFASLVCCLQEQEMVRETEEWEKEQEEKVGQLWAIK
jgi:hypothetical protein